MIRISVVIPTWNRPGPLAACLRALSAGFPADAETIVVSDGGREDLGPVVAPFVNALRLRVIAIEHRGPSAARNRGLEASRGEIVAFTDDDCRPHPGWLAALAGGVRLSPPRAVGGATRNGLAENVYADTAQLLLALLARHDQAVTGQERLLPSNNFAFPTRALIELGGFDERFLTAEDRELCRRWIAAGFALGRVQEAIVEHDDKLELASFVRKFVGYGRGAAKFHRTGAGPSLRESMAFHFRLPALIAPELMKRRPARAGTVAALMVLWEIANLIGFAGERISSAAHSRVAENAGELKVQRWRESR